MKILTEYIKIQTKGKNEMLNITESIQNIVLKSELKEGQASIFIPGATAGVTTIEYEDGLIRDFTRFIEKIIPQDIEYAHNLKWHDLNGHSHIRASLIGPSLTVPFKDGKLLLGTWQQITLIDFDIRGRQRDLICQLIGQ